MSYDIPQLIDLIELLIGFKILDLMMVMGSVHDFG
jgi:hypothetical protein